MQIPQATTPSAPTPKADALKSALTGLGKIGRVKMYVPIIDQYVRASEGVQLPTVNDFGSAIADAGTNLIKATSINPGSVAIGRGDATGKAIARSAAQYLGTPYSWGGGGAGGPSKGIAQGANTVGFDCSGLTQYAYGKLGITIPRVSGSQFNAGIKVNPNQAQAGDLVFFHPTSNGPGHVGIYLGNGTFIQAPQTGDVVKVSKLSDRSDLLGIRRYR
jgi:cell wall-associated NlpC family hydrolase